MIATSCEQARETELESRVEALPYYTESSFTPLWTQDSQQISELHTIGSFELLNQHNERITESTFANRIYVANFFFTFCPGICPKMTANMALIQAEFIDDPDVMLLSHSVTPEHDTPEVLNAYAENQGVIADKWHLVTGSRDDIYSLGREAYFVEQDAGQLQTPDAFLHTENFVLVDGNGHIRGIYNGLNATAIDQLIADIHTLKTEN